MNSRRFIEPPKEETSFRLQSIALSDGVALEKRANNHQQTVRPMSATGMVRPCSRRPASDPCAVHRPDHPIRDYCLLVSRLKRLHLYTLLPEDSLCGVKPLSPLQL